MTTYDANTPPPLLVHDLACYCGAVMLPKCSKFGWFYACPRWPDCDGKIGAHDDGRPLGTPADHATRAARIAAHDLFDRLWRQHPKQGARKRAYRWMRDVLKLDEDSAHIGMMTIAQCHALIAAVEKRLASEDAHDGIARRAKETREMIQVHERVHGKRARRGRRR